MKRVILIALLLLFGVATLNAQTTKKQQTKKTEQTTISLPKLCCESSLPIIDNTMAYEKGVVSWKVSFENKSIDVVYKPQKTNVEKIAKALAKSGFEANGIKADEKAIERLPQCCKNTAKGLESGCENKK